METGSKVPALPYRLQESGSSIILDFGLTDLTWRIDFCTLRHWVCYSIHREPTQCFHLWSELSLRCSGKSFSISLCSISANSSRVGFPQCGLNRHLSPHQTVQWRESRSSITRHNTKEVTHSVLPLKTVSWWLVMWDKLKLLNVLSGVQQGYLTYFSLPNHTYMAWIWCLAPGPLSWFSCNYQFDIA